MSDGGNPLAGWYPDPEDTARLRWWDGDTWTEHRVARQSQGVATTGLRGVGDFIGASFSSLGKAWKPLGLLLLVGVIPLVIAIVIADQQLGFVEWFEELMAVVEETSGDPNPVIDVPAWDVNGASAAIWALVIFILYLFAAVIVPMAAVPVLRSTLLNQNVELDAAVRLAIRALPRAFLVWMVSVLAIAAVVAFGVLLGLLIGPAVFLLVLPGLPALIYVSVRVFTIHQPIIVLEGLGLATFRRSWELTRGTFWGLFGRTLLFGLILSIAGQVVGIPVQLTTAGASGIVLTVSFAVSLGLNAFIGLAQMASTVVLYQDLTEGPPQVVAPQVWGPPPTMDR